MPRTPNDADVVDGALVALGNILVQNTLQQQANGTVMLNDDSTLQSKIGLATPALLLLSEAAIKTKLEWRKWQIESMTFIGKILDRVDQSGLSLDAIYAQNFVDAQRMLSNIEDNPTLLYNGVEYAVSTLHLEIFPREQSPLETKYGIPFVVVQFIAVFKLPPYLSSLPSLSTQPI